MEHKQVIGNVIRAAEEFNRRKLWKRFTNFDCFGIRITGQDELMLGVVLEHVYCNIHVVPPQCLYICMSCI